MRDDPSRLGAKVRALRRREGLSQAELARRLDVSPSYLNLIENNRRPLPAPLLVKLAQHLHVDLASFAADEDQRLTADLIEAFADPFFEEHALTSTEVRELTNTSPGAARAVLALYRAYSAATEMADDLSSRLTDGADAFGRTQIPSEEVSDLIQRHMNHFPALEAGAERLWQTAHLVVDDLYPHLVRHLEREHGVRVVISRTSADDGRPTSAHHLDGSVLRSFDPHRRLLTLSELLPTRSRTFQVAFQLGLIEEHATLDHLTGDPALTSAPARALARIALANYFAAAVLMPYEPFLAAARQQRYDIDILGRRFRVGFEQICHRLTTLRRPGSEGVPFHMIRIDVGGNISKRFSASGLRIARYSGTCPKWNIFSAFQTPGMIRIQVSRVPSGQAFFCLSRTIQKDSGGYHHQLPVMAIGVGCPIERARELVYSDGLDLLNPDIFVPIGTTCRTCERTDCAQRAVPSLKTPLTVDENLRGLSLYASPHGNS